MSSESRIPWGLLGLFGGVLAAGASAYALTPVADPDVSPRPQPTRSFAEAKARIAAVLGHERDLPLFENAGSIALLHGQRTERAVVLFHGYTVTPAQFALIAQAYYEAGANVWVPRMPYHGYRDLMTDEQSQITPDALRDHADASIDIATGLGERVEVVGLSGGGTLTLWCAVAREEVRRATAISPLLKPKEVPAWALQPIARVVRVIPDQYAWWEPDVQEALGVAGYPRFSYRAIAAFLALASWVERHGTDPGLPFPVDGRIVLVANDGDQRLDMDYNRAVVSQIASPRQAIILDIPASDRLKHDIIMVDGENAARMDLAYAHLELALGVELPTPSLLR